jgi:hypothetical protein
MRASISAVSRPSAARRARRALRLAGIGVGPALVGFLVRAAARAERPADEREDREHHEHGEQEDRHRRHELRPFAGDIAPGQLAGPPGEQRQGAPDLAFEMEHAVGEIVPEGGERAMDMAGLAALRAIGAGERRAAIQAGAAAVAVARLARLRLHRPGDEPAADHLADAFDAAHRLPVVGHDMPARRAAVEGCQLESHVYK